MTQLLGARNPSNDEPSLAEAPPLEMAGGYRIGDRIASGGMATVHVGVGPAPAYRPVAIKRMLPHLAEDADYVAMFLDEARLSGRIQHPNVCAVFDHGVEDGLPFMVMEMLVGQDLSQLTRAIARRGSEDDQRRLPRVGAKLLAEVCEGLHAAHELRGESGKLLGVVHRDVSPHNIFVTSAGVAKVIDFGIAKARLSSHRTATGTVKGKFGYMAPEQLRGERVDRRADVWSVGVVLWELVTGRRLFRRETESATMLAVLAADVPRLDELLPDAPPALQAILDRSLTADRDARYADIREMGEDLARFASATDRPVLVSEIAELVERYFADEIARSETMVRSAARRLVTQDREVVDASRVVTRDARPRPWRALVAAALLVTAAGLTAAFAWQDSPPPRAEADTPADEAPDDGTAPVEPPAEEPIAEAPAPTPERPEATEAAEPAATEAPNDGPSGVVRVRGRGTVIGPDGPLGDAPGRFELPVGSHRLRLRPVHGAGRAVRVRVREDQVTTVRMRAAPRPERPSAGRPSPEQHSPERPSGEPARRRGRVFYELDY